MTALTHSLGLGYCFTGKESELLMSDVCEHSLGYDNSIILLRWSLVALNNMLTQDSLGHL